MTAQTESFSETRNQLSSWGASTAWNRTLEVDSLNLNKVDVKATLQALRQDYFYNHFIEWITKPNVKTS